MDWVGVQCKRKHGVVALGWLESLRVAFLDSERGLGDSGLYRLDRKGLQYVRSAEERMGWRSNTNHDYIYHPNQVV